MRRILTLASLALTTVFTVATSESPANERPSEPAWTASAIHEAPDLRLRAGDVVTTRLRLSVVVPEWEEGEWVSELSYDNGYSYDGDFAYEVRILDADGVVLASRAFEADGENDSLIFDDPLVDCAPGAVCAEDLFVELRCTRGDVQVWWSVDFSAEDTASDWSSTEVDASLSVIQ